MDSETIYQPAPPIIPLSQVPIATGLPTKKPKLLLIFGGVAAILFSVALGITFFGNNNSGDSTPSSTTASIEEQVLGWPKYQNNDYFYELSIPEDWIEIPRSPLHTEFAIFNIKDIATLEIAAAKNTATLDEYLANQDEAHKSTIKVTSSKQVKVGDLDGFERTESWPKAGLQGVVTYVKISDMFYSFSLTPSGGKNAITSDSILRDYHNALSSFRLTDTTKLGVDLKDYASTKIDGLAFQAFSLKYPQTWVLSEKTGDNSLDVSIYRNNYELTISQKAIGGAVCLFNDSPAFEGSSGDLRSKQYAEFNTTTGSILRRYFNANAGEKSSMFFCEKQATGPYFQTPLTIGGLVYNVPAKYDSDIIKEMDEIVKSIAPSISSPSAATP